MSVLRSAYAYDLPEELIASEPVYPRSASRMLVLNREDRSLSHQNFSILPGYLDDNCLVLLNNTKVIPARLPGKRKSGAKIEALLIKELARGIWRCKVKNSARIKIGESLELCDGKISAEMIEKSDGADCCLRFDCPETLSDDLEKYGYAPLPPYIHKVRDKVVDRETDLQDYQTVFARKNGAIAAPTAGLHFSEEVFGQLRRKGVEIAEITLHVGAGTFEPVRVDDVTGHKMHEEDYEITREVSAKINKAKTEGKKIVAVGTTVCRALESAAASGVVQHGMASTSLFIYPPFKFQVVDQLITNFHLPESTLLMLVSAFADREFILKAYQEAVFNRYRFFSYGDCMLIH